MVGFGSAELRCLALSFAAVVVGVGCAAPLPKHPPFELGHPEGWRRTDLEWQNDAAASWRLVTPHDVKTPSAAALRAETYFYTAKSGHTLESFHTESTDHERRNCPGAKSTVLEQTPQRVLYEATAPFESECWGYQLVRLERGRKELHALIVYAHRQPPEEDREIWLQIVSQAIFDPER